MGVAEWEFERRKVVEEVSLAPRIIGAGAGDVVDLPRVRRASRRRECRYFV